MRVPPFFVNLAEHGTELIVLNNEDLSPEKEMIQDLISIIHVFFLPYLRPAEIQEQAEGR